MLGHVQLPRRHPNSFPFMLLNRFLTCFLRAIGEQGSQPLLVLRMCHDMRMCHDKQHVCRYDNGGGAQQPVQALSDQRASGSSRVERRCTLAQMTDEQMGSNGQPAYPQVAFLPRKHLILLHAAESATQPSCRS